MKSFKDFINEAVTVSDQSKNKYEYTHGKKPTGHGNWVFSANGSHVSFTGVYSEAARKAREHFRSKGHVGEIHVET